MKNLIVTLSFVLAAAGTTSAMANGTHDDPRTKETFAKKFTGAENVKWTKLNDGYEKVAFTLGGTRAEAYFGEDGELWVRSVIFFTVSCLFRLCRRLVTSLQMLRLSK